MARVAVFFICKTLILSMKSCHSCVNYCAVLPNYCAVLPNYCAVLPNYCAVIRRFLRLRACDPAILRAYSRSEGCPGGDGERQRLQDAKGFCFVRLPWLSSIALTLMKHFMLSLRLLENNLNDEQ
jgi:hypothetical protein